MSQVYLTLKWEDIEIGCNSISKSIIDNKINFDSIICIGRGGMIPSRILSDSLNIKNVSFIPASVYRGIAHRNDKVTMGVAPGNLKDRKILLVDDILDTGITLDSIVTMLQSKPVYDRPSLISIATLCCKNSALRKPSYYHFDIEENVWVIFPWEKQETEREMKNVKC